MKQTVMSLLIWILTATASRIVLRFREEVTSFRVVRMTDQPETLLPLRLSFFTQLKRLTLQKSQLF